ncbi:MAG: TetR/AcrR family transcriptional regulator [Moraxellaceae bacterium]|nr:TetR/AcrR family transcriptional regulator [Moraxellaceae bacterium]
MSEPATRRYRGASAEQRQHERRAKLLDAGLKVYGDIGYHAATVRGICHEAGLTERYFYESFANSEDLLCAVYEQVIASQRERMVAAIAAAVPDHAAMIRAGLTAFLAFVQESPASARVQFLEVLGVSPRVDQLYRRAIETFAQLLRGLSEGNSTLARNVDMDTLSVGLVGAMVGIGSRWMLSGFAQPLEDVVTTSHIIFSGVMEQLQRA